MPAAISPPKPRELLPPLLACLPMSAFSPRPPPALPELLTPILRQKLHVFASTSSSDSWLKLLNWNRDEAAKLPSIVSHMNLEAHPVSGEVEIEDVEDIGYRRLDAETLHARMEVEDFGLLPVYMWCPANANNGKPAWLVAELKALEDKDDSIDWYPSIGQAETAFQNQKIAKQQNGLGANHQENDVASNSDDDEDDDAYWAAYDRTPGRTPSKQSPAPGYRVNGTSVQPLTELRSELDYYERYASEVQPAMDPYDADEDMGGNERSDLNHHRREFVEPKAPYQGSGEPGLQESKDPVELVISVPDTPHHPQPSSASSPRSIKSLEEKAESQSQAEVAIKQHISTDLKSLYRLARSSGISRDEFERIVKTELEVLPLMDMD